jgi:imidazolonepropionase-like amidohydrolase
MSVSPNTHDSLEPRRRGHAGRAAWSSLASLRRGASVLALLATAACSSQAALQDGSPAANPVLYEGAWLFPADGRPPIERSALLVENGQIAAVGVMGSFAAPSARRVDLTGTFVVPALVDAHSHPGYTNIRGTTVAAGPYARDTVIDHLRRYAYYGVAATASLGLDPDATAFDVRSRPESGQAQLLTAGRGLAWPNAGPFAEYWRAAAYGVTTEADARAAVRALAATRVDMVKIWVDDRNGTVPKLPPPIYRAIIDESHRAGLRVVAHVYYLADGKELLRAGIDGFAHGIRDAEVDDEFVRLFVERKAFLLPNLPDGPPSEAELAWLAETLPVARLARMREGARARTAGAQRQFEMQLRSLRRLHAAGGRIGFGTDAGASFDGASFGWTAHRELADMVAAGLTPAEALVAATRTSAEILHLASAGTIAVGKSADFVVLEANPLDDIVNTRRIARVVLRGEEVDRAALRTAWSTP